MKSPLHEACCARFPRCPAGVGRGPLRRPCAGGPGRRAGLDSLGGRGGRGLGPAAAAGRAGVVRQPGRSLVSTWLLLAELRRAGRTGLSPVAPGTHPCPHATAGAADADPATCSIAPGCRWTFAAHHGAGVQPGRAGVVGRPGSQRRLASLRAARCQDRVLLLGPRLPLLPRSERFWGDGLLVPLGYRPEPDLPQTALREALGSRAEEILVLRQDRVEGVPRAALQPLTRAGVRLACAEGR